MNIVKFTNSPLKEVVLAIELENTNFNSIDFGLYWQKIRGRFPHLTDKVPIDVYNSLDSELPPLRRSLFLSPDKMNMVQIQDNFFSFNQSYSTQDQYPHFDKIFSRFCEEWETLQEWRQETGGNPLVPSAYRLMYLNVIDEKYGWNNATDHYKIFNFVGNNWNDSLGETLLHDTRLVIDLPNEKGLLYAELDQRSSEEDNSDFIIFNLNVETDKPSQPFKEWFQIAHEYVVKAFLYLTTQDAQQKWGRYEN